MDVDKERGGEGTLAVVVKKEKIKMDMIVLELSM